MKIGKIIGCVAVLAALAVTSFAGEDFSRWKKSGTLTVTRQGSLWRLDGGMQGGELSFAYPAAKLNKSKFAILTRSFQQDRWELFAVKGLNRVTLKGDKSRVAVNFALTPALAQGNTFTVAIKLFPGAALEITDFRLSPTAVKSLTYTAPKSAGPLRTFDTPVGRYTIPANFRDRTVTPRNSGLTFAPKANDSMLRSYVIDDPMELHPKLLPGAAEFSRPVSLFAAPDQVEGGAFTLYPLADLKGVTVRGGELTDEAGNTLAAPELRTVRVWPQRFGFVSLDYRDVPELLEKNRPLDLTRHRGQAYYAKYRIPGNAKPGVYRGFLLAGTPGKPELKIPVSLRVIDLKLRRDFEPIIGIYYGSPAAFPMLREYGFNSVLQGHQSCMRNVLKPLRTIMAKEPDVQKRLKMLYAGKDEPQLNYDEPLPSGLNNFLKSYKQFGFKRLMVWFAVPGFTDVIAKFLNIPVGGGIHSRLYPAKITPEYRKLFKDAITAISKRVKAAGVDIYWYQFDEIGVNSDVATFKYSTEMFKLVHETGNKTTVTCSDDDFVPMVDPYLDCRIYASSSANSDRTRNKIYRDTKKNNREFFSYTGCVYEQVHVNRYNAGFQMFRARWEGRYFWNLHSQRGDMFNDFDHPQKDSMTVYHIGKEYIPTLHFEGLRQGMDDYRYIHTLSALVADAKKSSRAEVRRAGVAAGKELAAMEKSLPYLCTPKSWDFRNFQRYRWRIATLAMELQRLLAGEKFAPQLSFREISSADRPVAARKQLTAPELKRAPAVDGKLAAGEWRGALHLPELELADGGTPPVNTQVWIGRDRANLYFAFRCEEPTPGKMVLKQTLRDHTVWRDECVELFIDPDHTRRNYKQLIITAKNLIADFSVVNGKLDKAWTCRGLRSAAKIYADHWVAEIAVPLSEVASGPVIGLNLQRTRQSYLSVSALLPRSHQAAEFADFTVAALPGRLAVEPVEPVRLGRNQLLVRNFSGAKVPVTVTVGGQKKTVNLTGAPEQRISFDLDRAEPTSYLVTAFDKAQWGGVLTPPPVLVPGGLPVCVFQNEQSLTVPVALNFNPAPEEKAELVLQVTEPAASRAETRIPVRGGQASITFNLAALPVENTCGFTLSLRRRPGSAFVSGKFRVMGF